MDITHRIIAYFVVLCSIGGEYFCAPHSAIGPSGGDHGESAGGTAQSKAVRLSQTESGIRRMSSASSIERTVEAKKSAISTSQNLHSVQMGENKRKSWKPAGQADFTLTAYALDESCTGKSPGMPGFGITSSGVKATVGRTVAVDPRVIPYGTLLYIDGLGWRVAEDTGGAIRGRHIDVLVSSRQTAIQFGIRRHRHVRWYPFAEPSTVILPKEVPTTATEMTYTSHMPSQPSARWTHSVLRDPPQKNANLAHEGLKIQPVFLYRFTDFGGSHPVLLAQKPRAQRN
jgi:3D (Asp-Asp-Asp) domain-containing protein